MSWQVLLVHYVPEGFHCPEAERQLSDGRAHLSNSQTRRQREKIYRAWRCGCLREPDCQFRVLMQTDSAPITYQQRGLGCAAELTGRSKDELKATAHGLPHPPA